MKAALWDTHVPLVRSVNLDGNKVEMDVSENLNDCKRLKVTGTPLMVRYVCNI